MVQDRNKLRKISINPNGSDTLKNGSIHLEEMMNMTKKMKITAVSTAFSFGGTINQLTTKI